jgi:Domain of unknown function (DUF1852)
MTNQFDYSITTTRFDEDYSPSESSRLTTNFANLARGEQRQQNLRNALTMIDRRFNALADWDNPHGDRYTVELDIVSVGLRFAGGDEDFPLIEVLDVHIVDRTTGARHSGIVGNNFSSYVRDYDFSVALPAIKASGAPGVPDDFGDLHGKLFDSFLTSDAYRERFPTSPVICISVSTSKTYRRTDNRHPVLGVEYVNDDVSLTDEYFAKMGMKVRFFMPPTFWATTRTCSSSARSARWRPSRGSTARRSTTPTRWPPPSTARRSSSRTSRARRSPTTARSAASSRRCRESTRRSIS